MTLDTAVWGSALQWINQHFWPVIIILVSGWLARHFGGAVITQAIRRLVRRTTMNERSLEDVKKRQNTLISMSTAVWRITVVVITGMVLFRQLFPSIDLTPVFASAGIVGLALGFGAQSLIKDLIAGIFIILENQYRVGDVVDLEGAQGKVEQITVRCTVLRDVDGNVHYVPNGSIVQVINKTMGFSKVNFTIAVSPITNVDELALIINKLGEKMNTEDKWKDHILDAPHFMSIGGFTNTAIEVKITGKTQPSKQWDVTNEYRKRLLAALKKQKIELAPVAVAPAQPVGKK